MFILTHIYVDNIFSLQYIKMSIHGPRLRTQSVSHLYKDRSQISTAEIQYAKDLNDTDTFEDSW